MNKTALIKKVKISDGEYPRLLKEIAEPPRELHILGELPAENRPKIAIVGTRKATNQGRLIAKKIAQELASSGVIVVSGLAMGIDTAAHEGALAANGQIIAVLGNGLNQIYPRQNENLAQRILDFKGAIISEYPDNEPAYPKNFLERNRIISGLSIATIVIEAPLRSGSLVTARLAMEQNREVLVIPGPSDHFNYKGSHQLIRDGARLVASAQDILEDLNLEIPEETKKTQNPKSNKIILSEEETDEEKILLKIIKNNNRPLKIDKIQELSKLETAIVNQNIALLIIKGIIKETAKGYTIIK